MLLHARAVYVVPRSFPLPLPYSRAASSVTAPMQGHSIGRMQLLMQMLMCEEFRISSNHDTMPY